jgi:hypothetical protein
MNDFYTGFIRIEDLWNGILNIDKLVIKLEENIAISKEQNKKLHLILSMANEICDEQFWYHKTVLLIRPFLENYNISNYKFVFNDVMYQLSTEHSDKSDCIFFDFNALRSYHRSFKTNQMVNSHWNDIPYRALMFIGKIDNKENRLPLLAKFYEQNLLDYVDWSLYFNDSIKQIAREMVPQFNDDEYENFMLVSDKKLDKVDYVLYNNTSTYSGFPYDQKLYESRCVSVIPETNFPSNNKIWITEKTFRTITNKHPFVMASVTGSLAYLRSIGFKTFEEYMLIKDYDIISDSKDRIDAIVQNTKYFIGNKHKYITEINADVEHNFTRFCEYCDAERKKLTDVLPEQDTELTWCLIGKM